MIDSYKKKFVQFYKNNKRMPSYSEVMKITSLKSKSSVYKLVNKLIEDRFLDKDPKGKLIPLNFFNNLKVLGIVEAGFPSSAEEDLIETMSLDDFLISNKESSYILKIKGDSMIDAGIHEGDLVIVEKASSAKDGQIIIAEIDQRWSIKYYRKKNNKVFLEAGNKKYSPIYPKEELKISAIVKAVIRKY